MNIIHFIKNANINGINVFDLKKIFKKKYSSFDQTKLISCNGKIIKCIKEYYTDPETGKKIKKCSIANECNKIRHTFSISNEVSCYACAYCHQVMIDKYLKGEVEKLK